MWIMPDWMEPYRSILEEGDQVPVEVRMKQCEDVMLVLSLPADQQLMPLVIRNRVLLLEKLRKAGLLLPIGKTIRRER